MRCRVTVQNLGKLILVVQLFHETHQLRCQMGRHCRITVQNHPQILNDHLSVVKVQK